MFPLISHHDRDLQRAWERLWIHYLDTQVSTAPGRSLRMEMGALCVCTWRGEDGNALFACEWRVSRLFCIFRKAQTLQINISAAKKNPKQIFILRLCRKWRENAGTRCHQLSFYARGVIWSWSQHRSVKVAVHLIDAIAHTTRLPVISFNPHSYHQKELFEINIFMFSSSETIVASKFYCFPDIGWGKEAVWAQQETTDSTLLNLTLLSLSIWIPLKNPPAWLANSDLMFFSIVRRSLPS